MQARDQKVELRRAMMKFKLPFICDSCGRMISPEDGIVIWNVNKRDWQVTLFVVHNEESCLGDELGNRENFPYSCALKEFVKLNGLRGYFNLLIAEEDWNVPRVKEVGPKLKLKPELFYLSPEEMQSDAYLIEAELSRRRSLLKQSIADTLGRFFDAFVGSDYWMTSEELHKAMMNDLNASG